MEGFLIVLMMKSSCDAQDLKETSNKIPGYICELLKDFNHKDPNIHDVLILNLGSESSKDVLSGVIQEIPEENPVILPKLGKRLDDTSLRPVSFVIITSNTFDMVS